MRDPRDAICSLAEMNQRPIREAISDWVIFAARYEDFFARTPEASVYSLRYEELTRTPEAALKPLFSWLGLSWPNKAVVAFLQQHGQTQAHELFAAKPSKVNVEAKIGRWHHVFTPDDVEVFKQKCGKWLVGTMGGTNVIGKSPVMRFAFQAKLPRFGNPKRAHVAGKGS